MNTDRQQRTGRGALVLGFFLLAAAAHGARVVEEPQLLRLQLYESYTEIEVEGQMDERSTTGSRNENNYLYVVPSVGLGLHGSVYHPYLLSFRLAPQLGWSWQEVELDPPGGRQSSARLLQRYHADLSLLQRKPYASTFFVDQDVSYRDFDFFTRARVDRFRLGSTTGYQAGPVPFSLAYAHLEEEATGLSTADRGRNEDTLTGKARNRRGDIGQTDASYQWQDFTTFTSGTPSVEGTSHNAHLIDRESLGQDQWINLKSVGLFHQMDRADETARSLTAHETLRLEHEPNLASTYDYSFGTRESGPVNSDSQRAAASLWHQLYESLTSTVTLDGEQFSTASPGSRVRVTRYGAAVGEQYTKRLGSSGRLSLGYSCRVSHEERDASGAILVIVDEAHTLTDGEVTYLENTGVDPATIVVTDSTGTILYREGFDYLVLPRGQLTEIQRVAGGTIPNGGSVLVDYTAVLQPSDEFDTLDQRARFRLEPFGRLFAVYGHLQIIDNDGGQKLVLQDVTDKLVGIETTWNGLRAGAEYQDYDSTLSSFRKTRLFQAVDFQATDDTYLGCDAGQEWIRFTGTDEAQSSYHVVGRLDTRLASFLRYHLEGGMRWERGDQIDQDLMTLRTDLNFGYGQLRIKIGYEFTDRDLRGDLQKRHYFFLRARRDF